MNLRGGPRLTHGRASGRVIEKQMRKEGNEHRCCPEAQDVGGRQQSHASCRQAGPAQAMLRSHLLNLGGTWRPRPASLVL